MTTDRSEIVLAPYQGAGHSRARKVMRWLAMPMLVVGCLIYGLLFGAFGSFMIVLFPIPLVILALLAIWALPEMAHPPTGGLASLFIAFPLSLILWPNYLALALPGMPWITMTRLVGIPMTLVLLVCLSTSKAVRDELSDSLRQAPWVWRMIAGFAALQLVSVLFSDRFGFSLQRVLASEINWTAIFFVSCLVFRKKGTPTLWAALFCATLVPMILITIREHQLEHVPWANHIPSFLKIEDESVSRMLAGARRDGGAYRIQGTFTTPLGLGEYFALATPFLVHFIVGPYRLALRIACVAILPVIFTVIVWSDARVGLIGFVLTFLLSGLLYGIFWWRRQPRGLIGPAMVLAYPALMVATFASTLVVGRFRNKIWGTGQYDASNEGRTEMYQEGIRLMLRRPWGYGAGRGAETLGITNPDGILTIDTYYVLIGLEYGIIGFLLYYGAFLLGTYLGGKAGIDVKDRRSEQMLLIPLTVALSNYVLIKAVFSNDENHPLAFIMLGMVLALLATARRDKAAIVERDEVAAFPAPAARVRSRRGSQPARLSRRTGVGELP